MNYITFKTAAGAFLGSVNLSEASSVTPYSTTVVRFRNKFGGLLGATFASEVARNAFLSNIGNVVKDAGRNNSSVAASYVVNSVAYTAPNYFED